MLMWRVPSYCVACILMCQIESLETIFLYNPIVSLSMNLLEYFAMITIDYIT